MHESLFTAATVWVAILLVACALVMLRSRSGLVRVLALDTMTLMLIALLILFSGSLRVSWYFDAALVLALLSFMSTISAARYYAEGRIFLMDTLQSLTPWIADVIVVVALFTMTIGVIGLAIMPDIYTKLHAASKAVVLGVVALTLASFITGDSAVIARTVLITCALIVTAPVSANAIANAAVRRNDRMRSPDSVNESPFPLNKADTAHVGDSGDARLRTLFGE